jgi:general stress protein YciG
MDEKKQRDIARKGGESVSQDREHMADIGRKGGESVSQDRQHMSDIGRKGGEVGGHRVSPEQHARAGRQSHKND